MRNHKIIKFFSVVLCIFVLFATVSFAEVQDREVPGSESLAELQGIGIFPRNLMPDQLITKAQFSEIMVKAAGLESKAKLYKGSSVFSDVESDSPYVGYVRVAVEQGFISAELNGLFKPEQNVDFSRVCTALVRELGYEASDLVGMWPMNYINKAEELELIQGIDLSPSDEISAGDLAKIIFTWMLTDVKDATQAYVQTTGVYRDGVILSDYISDPTLAQKQILTSGGKYQLADGLKPELGHCYIMFIDNNEVKALAEVPYIYEEFSIMDNVNGRYISDSDSFVDIPVNINYYFEGGEKGYSEIEEILETNCSIVLTKEPYKSDYLYGIIFKPLSSDPQVLFNGMITGGKLGSINIGDKPITKDGVMISKEEIELYDVVYEITDIWGQNGYILDVDDRIDGEITSILPSKMNPKTIGIDDTQYTIDSNFPIQKINGTGVFSVGDTVTLLLGNEGTAVDIIMNGTEDNGQYALVLDSYSEESAGISDYGTTRYYVDLLNANGNIKTYRTAFDQIDLKGELVTHEVQDKDDDGDEEWVTLAEIEYSDAEVHEIDTDNRMIDDYYLSDNVVIFNLVRNIYGGDSDAYIMDVNSLPNGKVPSDKIKYMHHVGDFSDINVVFVENILDEGYSLGVIEKVKTTFNEVSGHQTSLTIIIDGESRTMTNDTPGIRAGDVYNFRVSDGKILNLEEEVKNVKSSKSIQAIDNMRIKMDGQIYRFSPDVTIYEKALDGTCEKVGIDKLEKDKEYYKVTLYFDKSLVYGGEVEIITFVE